MSNLSDTLPEYTFGVHIDLGNDAMREPSDVADALERIAQRMRAGQFTGPIRDQNGNRVGEFHVQFWPTDDEDEGSE